MTSKVRATVEPTTASDNSLPKGWRMVRFGDVVRDVNEAERNPLDAGLERYVGLEHIEPENLHLTQWGNLADDDVSFTKRFRKGQVLFGKRRAYQRKVAVADFDGICSSDILTFEPNGNDLLPALLPFIVQSDGFFEHALGTSSGSLSPRTRWSQLKDYEFPLPPKADQCHIADILCAADRAIESFKKSAAACAKATDSIVEDLFRSRYSLDGSRQDGFRVASVDELCHRVSVGIVVTPAKYYVDQGVPCFRSANVRRGFVEDADWVYISPEAHQLHSKSILRAGDVLVVRSGVYAGMACVVPDTFDGVNCVDIVFATPRRELLLPDWLELYINSTLGRERIMKAERGLAQKHFNVAAMKSTLLPIPPIAEQSRWIEVVVGLRAAKQRLSEHVSKLRAIQLGVANCITEGRPLSGEVT